MILLLLALTMPDISTNTPRAHFRSWAECPRDYSVYKMTYSAKGDARAVFQRLAASHPALLWTSPSAFVQMMDLNNHENVRGPGDPVAGLRPNQVILLNLNLGLGVHIPVVFEVTQVDPGALHAAFGYVNGNKSQGLQDITFTQKGDTVFIQHNTCYQSGKWLRDAMFYPPEHHHLIRKFYDHLFGG